MKEMVKRLAEGDLIAVGNGPVAKVTGVEALRLSNTTSYYVRTDRGLYILGGEQLVQKIKPKGLRK